MPAGRVMGRQDLANWSDHPRAFHNDAEKSFPVSVAAFVQCPIHMPCTGLPAPGDDRSASGSGSFTRDSRDQESALARHTRPGSFLQRSMAVYLFEKNPSVLDRRPVWLSGTIQRRLDPSFQHQFATVVETEVDYRCGRDHVFLAPLAQQMEKTKLDFDLTSAGYIRVRPIKRTVRVCWADARCRTDRSDDQGLDTHFWQSVHDMVAWQEGYI